MSSIEKFKGKPQYMRESRNHTVTKFAAFVYAVRDTMCTKFCSKQTMLDKVTVKILKIPYGPKFADPKTAAASPYFKRSMGHANNV